MPNHISNKLKVIGTDDQVKEVMEFIKIDSEGIGTIDFNKITPMPKWVYGSQSNVIGISNEDIEKYGENNSLDWAREHWGTKWGAYQQPDSRSNNDTVFFETAWNGVPKLIHKIAWIFPEVIIEYSFADADLGSSNCGVYRFKDTEVLSETHYEACSKEAYELSFELVNNSDVPEYLKFDKSKNTYVEG